MKIEKVFVIGLAYAVIAFGLAFSIINCGDQLNYNLYCDTGYQLVDQTCVPIIGNNLNCGKETSFTFKLVDSVTLLPVAASEFNIVTEQDVLKTGQRTVNDPVGYYRFNNLVTCSTVQLSVQAPCYAPLDFGEDSYFNVPVDSYIFELPLTPLQSCTDNELQTAFNQCLEVQDFNGIMLCCEAFTQPLFDLVCLGTPSRN